MAQPQPIRFIDNTPNIPEAFWAHIESEFYVDEYPVLSLYDDSREYYGNAGNKGIHYLLKTFGEREDMPSSDIEKARKWVSEFAEHYGDHIDLLLD